MIRIYNREQIEAVVALKDLVDPLIAAFTGYSDGRAEAPLAHLHPDARSELHIKAASLAGSAYCVVKVAGWSAVKLQQEGISGSGMVLVLDALTTDPIAILRDDSFLTDLRTAAAGALLARVLAPRTVLRAGVLGTGIQARLQAHALYLERPFEHLAIWGRDPAKADALVAQLASELPHVAVRAAASPRQVVEESDCIVTTTMSTQPIIEGLWLRPGQHITAIGADSGAKVELDPETLHRAKVVVDSLRVNLEYGDLAYAVRNGGSADGVVELGEVYLGRAKGRIDDSEFTVGKLVGLGVQDLIAAEVALSRLRTNP